MVPERPDVPTRVPLPESFVNDAGKIQNLVLHDVGCVSVIHTRAGQVRANHKHREDYHYLYLLSGRVRYYEHDEEKGIVTVQRFVEGELIFTPPGVNHAFHFVEDTVMVSMSRFPRDHESHESDVIRLPEDEWLVYPEKEGPAAHHPV